MEIEYRSRQSNNYSGISESFVKPASEANSPRILQKTDSLLTRIDAVLPPMGNIQAEKLGNRIDVQAERPSQNAGTASWIRYFDNNWHNQGLQRNWSDLTTTNRKHVGFVMRNQMAALEDPSDKDQVENWATKTKRDLEGFKLEFLSDSNVYPRIYRRNPEDPTRLEDPLYGRTKDGRFPDIVEITSDEERNGSIKKALGTAKEFLKMPDTAAVISSPIGPTGFKDQDGRGIDYIDSYFFVMVNQGDSVMNYTIKTDFKLPQVRNAIRKLTGKEIAEDAPVEDYVGAVAKIKFGESKEIKNVFDLIRVLEDVQPSHAFKDKKGKQETKSWRNVYDDVVRGEKLYNFEAQTQDVLNDFYEYARSGEHSKKDLQKAIAVAILRMSDHFFASKNKKGQEVKLENGVWEDLRSAQLVSFGARLKETAEIRGCAGGGGGFDYMSILNPGRSTEPGGGGAEADDKGPLRFKCNKGHWNKRDRNDTIPNCTTCGDSVSC